MLFFCLEKQRCIIIDFGTFLRDLYVAAGWVKKQDRLKNPGSHDRAKNFSFMGNNRFLMASQTDSGIKRLYKQFCLTHL